MQSLARNIGALVLTISSVIPAKSLGEPIYDFVPFMKELYHGISSERISHPDSPFSLLKVDKEISVNGQPFPYSIHGLAEKNSNLPAIPIKLNIHYGPIYGHNDDRIMIENEIKSQVKGDCGTCHLVRIGEETH